MTALISTTQDLASLCAQLGASSFVTIDTEFMRERTYYSKLCLIQLADAQGAYAVDPLAPDLDLTPLFELLANPDVLKVFHAARQDVEIFVDLTGRVPTPLFDTQVAAMVCGFGDSVSYSTLAHALTGAVLDKSSRFTDWSRRPLRPEQISYALSDVTYLRTIYEKLRTRIEKQNRQSWVQEEMDVLTNIDTYKTDPLEQWQRLKLRHETPRRLAVLRELAAWREIQAQKENLPRGRIVKDELLIELAHQLPKTQEELASMRGMATGFERSRTAAALLQVIEKGCAIPQEECPSLPPRVKLSHGASATLELLRVLLRGVSEKEDVAAKLIASAADLELLASEDHPDISALKGWRKEIFGQTALALKRGEIALTLKNNKVTSLSLQENPAL
ncbi:MAG: ribonuclease D [Alphaproteobacteria bacterium]|nr:ribonuclease D [Alphaproteobacteria bacterium]